MPTIWTFFLFPFVRFLHHHVIAIISAVISQAGCCCDHVLPAEIFVFVAVSKLFNVRFIFPRWQNGGSVASQFCDTQNC
jgi:hypothetical protein